MPTATVTPGAPRERIQARLPDGRIFEMPPGTPLAEVTRAAAPPGEPPAVAAIVNGKLRELTSPLKFDSDVQPVNLRETDGMRIYRRSLTFLLVTAAAEVFPDASILIEHSGANGGFYCTSAGRPAFSQAELDQIAARMREIVAADEPFERTSVPLAEAVALFRARGELDKAQLLANREKNELVLYRLRGRRDYFQGYMTPSAGYLQRFGLQAYPRGFVLIFPRQEAPDRLPTLAPYPKLFDMFEEAGDWLERLGIRTTGALNQAIAAGRLREISLVAEALQEGRVAQIAEEIAAGRERVRVVLAAGPSASGKTTFSKRLAIQLLAHGLRPLAISLDDYFLNRADTPFNEYGQRDFESLRAVDVPLFNAQLNALIAGRAVTLPRYNFVSGQRESGPTVQPGSDSVFIVEGIHGLNPDLAPELAPERLYRVYISALTQLNLDRHNRVSTTDCRLIRRLVRDAATRGYNAAHTLRRWEEVKRGEKQHIFPFQDNGDAMFNSALVHELAVLRPLAEPLLLQVRADSPEFIEANRLLSFLQWFRPAPAEGVPDNSILREFIGGSSLAKFHVWQAPASEEPADYSL